MWNRALKMPKSQTLRGFINQRLSLAAEEIFELFERTIAEYEEQLCRSKEENERQHKLLEAVFNPEVRLHRADAQVQTLLVKTENVPAEQQERGPSLDQEGPPEPAHIKEEEEEVWRCQEEEAESSQLDEKQTEEMFDCESETDVSSDYLEESAKPQSALNHVSHMESNSVETAVSVSERATSSGPKEPEPDATKIQKEKPFSCSVCGKCFKKESRLFRHEKTAKGDHGGLSGQNLLHQKEAANSDVTKKSEKNQESSSDGETKSEQKKEPQEHKEIPKNEKPFCCFICDGKFSRKYHLKEHMSCHSGEKPFCCSFCSRRFRTSDLLIRHSFIHSTEKPYCCAFCGKTFAKKGSLKRHVVSHTGEKPHCCSVCGESFPDRQSLRKHSFIHTARKTKSITDVKLRAEKNE